MSDLDNLRNRLRRAYLADESDTLKALVEAAGPSSEDRRAIAVRAEDLVVAVRCSGDPGVMEAFLAEYGLSTREGIALMCLAEALLRVPDAETIDDLIADKIAPHDWSTHLGDSGSILVNASTWALMLTGQVLDEADEGVIGALRGAVKRLGEPVIRTAVSRAMKEIGAQFVLGVTMEDAMARGAAMVEKGYRYSFDMLGEAARTADDAERYHQAYASAIEAIAAAAKTNDVRDNPGISVKLSALHPRYEYGQRATTVPDLVDRTLTLARAARDARIGFNIDAEEADRLDLSLDVIGRVLADEQLVGWDGFGVVVQAYGQRAGPLIDWLYALAEHHDRRLMVRLVKGAYWDTEIKRAQTLGIAGFPVFTRKVNTDVSYICCARKLLAMGDRIYSQFATHNAHTAAAIVHMAGNTGREDFEFQRLHGMGEALHEIIRKQEGTRCRIYAPVGAHRDLLAYLVRRLLENGANSSFVHQIVDETVDPKQIAADPFDAAQSLGWSANPAIETPDGLYGDERPNSKGWDITDPLEMDAIETGRSQFAGPFEWSAGIGEGEGRPMTNPAVADQTVGRVFEVSPADIAEAAGRAQAAQPGWAATPVAERSQMLRTAADLYEAHAGELFALAAREAGKTLADCVAEVREAVDFLRYYAAEATRAEPGTGARGVIACISPWNFPLAIFTGQISAALAAGNAVIAKPAEQTPLIAARAVALLHEAGIPSDVLQLTPGDGPNVGAPLVADPRIAGVCFTGSTEVAKLIDRQLARTAAPDAMLIAETGGLNAMIVDSTALPEQAVGDIVASAFQSAGQRCSALRVLYVQRDIEERLLEMLFGAMDALVVGDPWDPATDVGPLIDREAYETITAYCDKMRDGGRMLKQMPAPDKGLFVPPCVIRVEGIGEIEREVFGPVLHVASYEADEVGSVVDAINARGYGLTFGVHTRIDRRVQDIVDGVRAGNLYVNRNQIGAIVGSQPFGGEGLSGTGPKAGGPHYLRRFRTAKSDGGEQAASEPVVSTGEVAKALAGLDAGGWAARPDRISVLRGLLRGRAGEAMAAAAALDCGPVDLPGPTGESNRLALAPRGPVLCLGPDAETALDQAVQSLRVGNATIVICDGLNGGLEPLLDSGLPLAVLEGAIDAEALAELDVSAVAYCGSGEAAGALRDALASRPGPIVPLITERIYPAAFAHERAICIDTTAAGGNAALLAKV